MDLLYPIIHNDYSIHYYGEGSIIRSPDNYLTFFDQTQTDIIELCMGKYNTKDIEYKIFKLYNINVENGRYEKNMAKKIIREFLTNLNKSGYIKFEKKISYSNIKVTGKRGQFFPRNIYLELTNYCNLYCEHCFKNANNINKTFLGLDKLESIITMLEGNTFEIQLTGGEPFAHPEINKILKKIIDKFYISVTTNGTYIDKIEDDILKKINFIQISMYGFNEDEYGKMTKNYFVFDKFKKSVTKINNLEIENLVTVVLNKDKINSMEQYVKTIYECGGKKIKFGLPSPLGRAVSNQNKRELWDLSVEDETYIYEELKRLNTKYKHKINVIVWDDINTNSKNILNDLYTYTSDNNISCFDCGAGSLQFNISENGDITPCQLLPQEYFHIGNIEQIPNMINGNHNFNLIEAVNKYNNHLLKNNINCSKICPQIKNILNRGYYNERVHI